MWWVGLRRSAAGAALLLAATASAAGASAAGASPSSGESSAPESHSSLPQSDREGETTNDISLELDGQGVLHAEETISFGDDAPDTFTRTFVTRQAYDTNHDRRYELSDIAAAGSGGKPVPVVTEEKGRKLTATMDVADSDTVVLRYEVRGAVDGVGDGVETEWAAVGGYSSAVAETTVTVEADAPPVALSCTAGEPRSSIYCTSSDMGGHQALVARFLQTDLTPGERLEIVVSYPSGTAPAEPLLERKWSLTSAFAVTSATASVFGLLLVVLVGGLVGLIRLRGRDERALRTEACAGDSAPVTSDGAAPGGMRFHPPDGVHPGQIGTLIDEQADIVDITATVVDLAVRGYFTIHELEHEHFTSVDWQLEKRPGPFDDTPLAYERLLLDALFHGRDRVRLSDLGSGEFPKRLARVREELYRDMVRLRWFSRRPNLERNRWATAGIALTAAGVALTVLLAIYTQAAFTGLAVIIAGAAVTVGAQYMPAKTRQGSVVFAHTMGFRAYLLGADAERVPAGCRVQLFSHYLPYAIIFDNVERWANVLASAGSDEMGEDALPWYVGPAQWRMADFADSIKSFTVTLTGVLSNTRQFPALG
ncbi:putative membrane protein DUF2207 [Haloactinospora alba]|uniref:Putative membrane protein DUF2207 n=1 Tax=Haloactinospora alba TaxID=405555 RepID=A0A543N6Z5_9ACTN|nr:DUF2207 domain-containing protein [Haloactinospora alba]TQN27601.1 putative membrane protein DUF2207 [Haloactinospora alba]